MHVRHCGINSTHTNTFKIEKPYGFGDFLFLRLKTPTRFYLNGEIIDAAQNDIILYGKGDPQYYETLSDKHHIDDYMFFDISNAEDQHFMEHLSICCNQLFTLPDTHPFMSVHNMICEEFISRNPMREESLHCLLRYFLIKLSECMNADYSSYDHAMYQHLNELRHHIYNSPSRKWTVNMMAEYMRLSPSYFQSVYRKYYHISCMADLFHSRMNHARALLAATSLPISEVASRCGYESNIYFSRHFKKKTGMTPSEYRNSQTLTVSQEYLPDTPAGKTEADRPLP
ncbi:MAG: helix-turn-helix transcriptional regulator [Lachnospiraceae bacterium]|nr:helix-turn-helix transcriptional regulator [Lachnospiraceae bacterium]